MTMRNNRQGGFTLIEVITAIVMVAVLVGAAVFLAQGYINRSNDSARLQGIDQLSTTIDTYRGKHIAPPLNQFWLVAYEMLSKLPADPENEHLFQFNCDLRGWTKSYPDQCGTTGGYLLATNRVVSAVDHENWDEDRFINTDVDYKTSVKNLKYYGGYIVWDGSGDANLLTDNGDQDTTGNNVSPSGPGTPVACGSVDGNAVSTTLDMPADAWTAIVEEVKKWVNLNLATIYGDIPGAACVIQMNGNSTQEGTSPVNTGVTRQVIKGDDYGQGYN